MRDCNFKTSSVSAEKLLRASLSYNGLKNSKYICEVKFVASKVVLFCFVFCMFVCLFFNWKMKFFPVFQMVAGSINDTEAVNTATPQSILKVTYTYALKLIFGLCMS